MTSLQLHPQSGSFGAEVSGLDLTQPIAADIAAELYAAWLQYKVLFFRDQRVTPAQFTALGKVFGAEFMQKGRHPQLDGYPHIWVQAYPFLAEGPISDFTWHTDAAFMEIPLKATALYAVDVPEAGGDTAWCDTVAAYEDLSAKLQNMLSGLTARHDFAHYHLRNLLEQMEPQALAASLKAMPPAEHPVVCTHPETGCKSLFVSELLTSEIVGMKPAESRALLEFLFAHQKRTEFQCRFHWREHSIAVWDNRSTNHKGVMDFGDQTRVMHRWTILGEAKPSA
jgi:taurine dioxygenase